MRGRLLWVGTGLAALVLAAGAPLVADPQGSSAAGRGGHSSRSDERMAQDLKLTEEQKSQLKSINQSRQEQIRAVAHDKSLTGQQRSERIREINRNAHTQIAGMLTPEQRDRWQRRWRDRREDRRDRKEDIRDRREDRRDHREDIRDRRPR